MLAKSKGVQNVNAGGPLPLTVPKASSSFCLHILVTSLKGTHLQIWGRRLIHYGCFGRSFATHLSHFLRSERRGAPVLCYALIRHSSGQ